MDLSGVSIKTDNVTNQNMLFYKMSTRAHVPQMSHKTRQVYVFAMQFVGHKKGRGLVERSIN